MNQRDITLTREELYDEVWELSVSGVAKKYEVDYANLLRICKESDIPIPPQQYWFNKNTGKETRKEPLPESQIEIVNLVAKKIKPKGMELEVEQVKESVNVEVEKIDVTSKKYKDNLLFLESTERAKIISEAENITIETEKKNFSRKISSYRKQVEEWNKKDIKGPFAKRAPESYMKSRPPFLAGVISEETLPRALRIIETLGEIIEKHGGELTDDLSFKIRGESVSLKVYEYQDRIDHVLTKDEKYKLLEYEDNKKRGRYAYMPSLAKYDYIFNGRLNVSINKGKTFRDSKTSSIEEQLDTLLIELYEQSEANRLDRLAVEERERIYKEEKEKERLFMKKRDEVIEATIELKNYSLDYDMACKIRAFIEAVKCKHDNSEEISEWVEWANKKADWFDPTIAREDEHLGTRTHGRDEEYKQLKKSRSYWG